MAVIGIDLGTTNSLCAVWRKGRSELIPNAAGNLLTPSAVSVDEDGSILVGEAARDRLITHPDRSAAFFKRAMGSGKKYTLAGKDFLPEELSSFVLRSLRQDAEAFLGQTVTEAVVSVPAYFNESQRAATKRSAALAGLRVERLVNEPSAAALAGRIGEGGEEKLCLVFDLGGGTLDVSLVERFENVISVIAVCGDNQLGGRDFDRAIAEGFCQDCGLSRECLSPRQRELILRQAEICKIALSAQDPVIMAVDDGEIAASLLISNEWLIRKCSALFKRLTAPVRKVFLDAGISPRELDDLVMVGGSSHMPSIRRYIARFLNRRPLKSTRPDTAIALGAGVCAGIKIREAGLEDLVVTDVCPFTLGTDVLNPNNPEKPLLSPIIERNSVLPASRMGVYRTTRDNQDQVDIRVYQGENRYCADNILLGKLVLKVPPAPKGEQSVRIRFSYDINGLLEVEALNEEGESARLLLRSDEMSDAEVQRRLQVLQGLKIHPREQEANRILISRGERLYASTVGHLREQVGRTLEWFQYQLDTQNPTRVARSRLRAERFFDQVESWMGNPSQEWDEELPENWMEEDGDWEDEE